MIDLDNAELQNALQIIQFTRRSLFLTGKAGTGKSTFLRYIAANTKKKHKCRWKHLAQFLQVTFPPIAAQRQYVFGAQYPKHTEI